MQDVLHKDDVHFSCSVNHIKDHEGLCLGSLYLPGTNRLSVTSYT